jgi:hypothetical protein
MTWAAYGPPWAAYAPQNPSDDGIRWHDMSENASQPARVPAGKGMFGAGHDRRPQQDSNLRSRLRSPVVRSSEFVQPTCSDSIARLAGRNLIPRIFRIMELPRDRPHCAGDGPRPVRAGSTWPLAR